MTLHFLGLLLLHFSVDTSYPPLSWLDVTSNPGWVLTRIDLGTHTTSSYSLPGNTHSNFAERRSLVMPGACDPGTRGAVRIAATPMNPRQLLYAPKIFGSSCTHAAPMTLVKASYSPPNPPNRVPTRAEQSPSPLLHCRDCGTSVRTIVGTGATSETRVDRVQAAALGI